MNLDNALKKVLKNENEEENNGLSFDEKLEIISDLVSSEVANTLKKQIIISKTTNRRVEFSLASKEIKNSDNIYAFLKMLGTKETDISGGGQDYSSDYTGGRDYYDVPTYVSFKI